MTHHYLLKILKMVTENQGNLFATSGAVQLHFSRSMHTYNRYFKSAIMPPLFQWDMASIHSPFPFVCETGPAHSTKLVSIIVYFCNPSQESLDLCKPKSAWWHHFYWKWCHCVLLSDPQCNQEFHEIVSHKAAMAAMVPTPLMELSQSQSRYSRYSSYTTDEIVTFTKLLRPLWFLHH